VNSDLHVIAIRDRHATVDGRRRGPPVFVQFQPARPRLDLLFERPGQAAIPLTEEAQVKWKSLGRLKHALQVPGAGSTGGRVGAGGRPRSAAQERS